MGNLSGLLGIFVLLLIAFLLSENRKKINIKTAPYPGFPTDLQAQIMILMTQVNLKKNLISQNYKKKYL